MGKKFAVSVTMDAEMVKAIEDCAEGANFSAKLSEVLQKGLDASGRLVAYRTDHPNGFGTPTVFNSRAIMVYERVQDSPATQTDDIEVLEVLGKKKLVQRDMSYMAERLRSVGYIVQEIIDEENELDAVWILKTGDRCGNCKYRKAAAVLEVVRKKLEGFSDDTQ